MRKVSSDGKPARTAKAVIIDSIIRMRIKSGVSTWHFPLFPHLRRSAGQFGLVEASEQVHSHAGVLARTVADRMEADKASDDELWQVVCGPACTC